MYYTFYLVYAARRLNICFIKLYEKLTKNFLKFVFMCPIYTELLPTHMQVCPQSGVIAADIQCPIKIPHLLCIHNDG